MLAVQYERSRLGSAVVHRMKCKLIETAAVRQQKQKFTNLRLGRSRECQDAALLRAGAKVSLCSLYTSGISAHA